MGPSDTEERDSMMDSSTTDDNSFEFRILMAYAKRTLPIDIAPKAGKEKLDQAVAEGSSEGTAHNVGSNKQAEVELRQTDKAESAGEEKSHARKSKGKKKPIWKRIPCLRGESKKSNTPSEGMGEEDGFLKSSHKVGGPEAECEPSVNEVAEMLQKIINSKGQKATSEMMMIRSYSLEADAAEDEQRALDQIIALLTTQGDNIEEEIKKDSNFTRLLGEKPSHTIFKRVMDSVLEVASPTKMNSDKESETEKLKIAFVVHATTRFAAVSNHPMAQIMGFGAKYLQENCTTWVTQKGGWAKLLEEEHID